MKKINPQHKPVPGADQVFKKKKLKLMSIQDFFDFMKSINLTNLQKLVILDGEKFSWLKIYEFRYEKGLFSFLFIYNFSNE